MESRQGLESLDQRLATLEDQLQHLQAATQELKRERAVQARAHLTAQQRALLGHAARVLSCLVESFVFDGADAGGLLPLSLKQIGKRADRNEMNSEQLHRWHQAQKHVTPGVIAADQYLRKLFDPEANAAGAAACQYITTDSLLLRANGHCSACALLPVRELIQLLSQCSSADRPLLPDKPWSSLT